jgi:fibronectin-binding autotransporter adhesin
MRRAPALLLFLLALPAAATDYHWMNASGGAFATPGNWNPSGPPGPADNAILDLAGTYTVTVGANASISAVSVGTATALVTLSISNGVTLTINGGGNTIYNGSGISNAGTLDFKNTSTFGQGGGGPSTVTVTNTGTIKKTAGAGASGFVNASLTSSGTIDAELGSITLIGGGTVSGPVVAASGADVFLSGDAAYTVSAGASFSGAGRLRIGQFQTASLTTNVAIPHLKLEGGVISGSGNLNVSGTLEWDGGGFSGSGTTTIALSAVASIPNAGVSIDQSRTLVNAGTVNQSAGLNAGSGTSIQNSGTWTFLADVGLGNVPTITNTGTFRKTGGTGTSILEVGGGTMTSSGTIEAHSGTLLLSVSLTNSGTLSVDVGATLAFTNFTYTIQSGTMFSGDGVFEIGNFATLDVGVPVSISNLTIAGGVLAGPGDVTIGGALTWTAGGMTGSGTTTIAGGAVAAFPPNANAPNLSRALNVMGTLLDQNANSNPVFVSGASVTVSGTFDVQSDKKLAGANGASLAVSGTMKKSFGSGMYTLENVAIHNTGAVQAKTGTLALTGSSVLTQTAGSTSLLGGNLSSANAVAIQGGSLMGAGTLTGNVVNSGGHVAPGSSAGALTIAGSYTQGAGASFDVEVGGLTPGSYDTLAVTGSATLAGALNVSLVNGFAPTLGNAFPVFSFGSISGTFADLGGPTGLCMSFSSAAMNLVKNAPACGIHADADGDHQLAVSDVFYDINSLFAAGPRPHGWSDANADGVLSVADVFYVINFLFAGGPAPQ